MKRYLLFGGNDSYGGWSDFLGDYNFIKEAKKHEELKELYWYQIVDTKKMKIVKEVDR